MNGVNEMKRSWKQIKVDVLTGYRPYYNDYAGCIDDRAVFRTVYDMIREALDSLPEEPALYIRCAMAHELKRDFETMEEIVQRFPIGVKAG